MRMCACLDACFWLVCVRACAHYRSVGILFDGAARLAGNLSDVQACAMLPCDVAMLSCVSNNGTRPFEVGCDPHLVAVGSSNGVCRVFVHDNGGRGEGTHDKCPHHPGDRIVWRPSAIVTGGIVFGRRRPQRLVPLWQFQGTSRVAALRWCSSQAHRRLLAVGFLGGRNKRSTLSMCVEKFLQVRGYCDSLIGNFFFLLLLFLLEESH